MSFIKTVTATSMKAIQFARYGAPEVLELCKVAIPEPKEGEILIRVKAAGLNPIDYKTRNGTGFVATEHIRDNLPSGLGYDFAGEVVDIGRTPSKFQVGDHVMGLAGGLIGGFGDFPNKPCAYAEYVCAIPRDIIKKPELLSWEQAAAVPTAGLTALQALRMGRARRGDKVLVLAGAGGVGHLAIQLAKKMRCKVWATASKYNHDFLRELGADNCIDYHEEDPFRDIINTMDIVIDNVGGASGIQSIDTITDLGCIITIPTKTALEVIDAAAARLITSHDIVKKNDMEELELLAKLHNKGHIRVEIMKTFYLGGDQAIEAHTLLETGKVRGKLVFKI